jgi:hypothetical protein
MDRIDNFRERFEALERQTEPLQHQTRTGAPRWWWCLPWRVAALVVLGLALAHPNWVQAKTFRCRAGDVQCLIDAINAANANGQTNTIRLAAGTYTLTAVDNNTDGPNGLPSITSPLTLQGAGAASTILRHEREPSVPFVFFRLVHVAPSGDLQVERLTLTGGVPFDVGGGLWNAGTVRLLDCAISGNGTAGAPGGGIFNSGTLHVTHSTITNNATSIAGGISGGGIYNSGTVTLTQSTIASNGHLRKAGHAGVHRVL